MPFGDRPVLVTGAGGFIGGRIVEVLHQLPGWSVRASVRRWSSAARIGRFPVEIVFCDVTDRAQVRAAMEGVGAVVHCATGGRDAVRGMRNVLECAEEAGVERVVHFSTIEVYGDTNGEVDESVTPIRTGRDYADGKIETEELCLAAVERGLEVSILRPSLVYGPFSPNWTIEIAERLVAGGAFPSGEDAAGLANLVYVDDVVQAALLALQRPEAVGEAFNVNGLERVTWNEYLDLFRESLGLESGEAGTALTTRLRTLGMMPIRSTAKWALRHFEEPIMALYKRSGFAKRLMGGMESAIRQTPTLSEYRLLKRQAYFPTDKARRLLGYEPRYSLPDGMAVTAAWLKHHGFRGRPELASEDERPATASVEP